MSVKQLPNNRLRLICDGRTPQGPCSNSYELANESEAMKAANEYLERRGWRTTMDGYVQLHWCSYCANRMDIFNPQRVAKSGAAKKGKSVSIHKDYAGRARA